MNSSNLLRCGATGNFLPTLFGAALFLMLFAAATCRAQCPQITLQMNPQNASEGDTVTFEVHVDADDISGFQTTLSFDPLVYDISNVEANAVSSWLGQPDDLDVTATVSGSDIDLDVERKDQGLRSGDGLVVNLDGIVILDDINTKVLAAMVEATAAVGEAARLDLGPNPSTGLVRLAVEAAPRAVWLQHMDGRRERLPATVTQDLRKYPGGVYWMEAELPDGRRARTQLLLQR